MQINMLIAWLISTMSACTVTVVHLLRSDKLSAE